MNNSAHWADRGEKTSVWGVKLLLSAYAWGGKFLFLPLLAPVILFFYCSSAESRQGITTYLQNMHDANSSLPAATRWNGFKVFWAFGQTVLDKFSVWQGNIARHDVTVHNYDAIESLTKNGRGALLLMSHLGNFEICRALSRDNKTAKLTVLLHTKHAQQFNAILKEVSQDSSVELLQVSEVDAAMAIVLAERIGRGELIAIAADRVPVAGVSVFEMPFFNKMAPFPKGPFILSAILASPVLAINCVQESDGYHIYFKKLYEGGAVPRSQRNQFLHDLAAKYVDNLQERVSKAPFQWFNFFDFWQMPKRRK